jgi:hypothetical protein
MPGPFGKLRAGRPPKSRTLKSVESTPLLTGRLSPSQFRTLLVPPVPSLFISTRLIYYFAMAKRIQSLSHSRIYPMISTKERLAIWEKARGLWKKRGSDPIEELKKMRASWSKKNISLH